jgi:hypothetical protein
LVGRREAIRVRAQPQPLDSLRRRAQC